VLDFGKVIREFFFASVARMVQRAGMLAPVLPQIAPTGNPQRHFGAILREILETYSPVRVGADRMQAWRRLKPTPTAKNERLGRGPEGPHYPNSHPQAPGQFATEAR
jgi:hypothetical protein